MLPTLSQFVSKLFSSHSTERDRKTGRSPLRTQRHIEYLEDRLLPATGVLVAEPELAHLHSVASHGHPVALHGESPSPNAHPEPQALAA